MGERVAEVEAPPERPEPFFMKEEGAFLMVFLEREKAETFTDLEGRDS